MSTLRNVVHRVLAHHAGLPKSAIHPWQDLERDLDMTRLEVVLVAHEIDGIEDVDLDLVALERVRTVGELSSFITREVARAGIALADLDVA